MLPRGGGGGRSEIRFIRRLGLFFFGGGGGYNFVFYYFGRGKGLGKSGYFFGIGHLAGRSLSKLIMFLGLSKLSVYFGVL